MKDQMFSGGPTVIRLGDWLLGASRMRLVTISGAAICVTAWLDWYNGPAVTFGALYLVPIILISGTCTRWQIIATAVLCGLLRVQFNPSSTVGGNVMTGAFAILAYGLVGTLLSEVGRNRQRILDSFNAIRREQELRRDAEEQLRILAEGSPAAIFTLDEHATILSANRATRELLQLDTGTPVTGQAIAKYLPPLAEALRFHNNTGVLRTTAQIQGTRADGSPFLAQVCFSTYKDEMGSPRLAAIAFDTTEDAREREEQSQQQLLESNRIIAGAVAHEVRNVCGAMAVVHSNLEEIPGVAGNKDYVALGELIRGLEKLARLELHTGEEIQGGTADIRDVLSQLRILIEPTWQDEGAVIDWPDLPHPILVAADSFTLLQSFLNIANNSLAALANAPVKRLSIDTNLGDGAAHIEFSDTGAGVGNPDTLFQPFRSGATRVGLGLYISRALLRKHGGDICYEPSARGARFIVEIPLCGAIPNVAIGNTRDPALVGR